MEKTKEKQNVYYLVYAGKSIRQIKSGKFVAGFAEPQAAMDYAGYLIDNRVYPKYLLIYITKQDTLEPVFHKKTLAVIIAASGEILMMDGKMYDY